MTTGTSYRPDIEGLRAVAILAVLAFHHEWAPCFGGGFVGVDVFFVISGYLITRNVFTQTTNGDFSFSEFYIRRISRLIPALVFTIALILAIGIYIASPADLKHLSESAIASIFSVSNFYFWGQSGYFDTSAIQKPLLHTWALAVEEQFYLVWPIVVVLLVRYCKKHKPAIAVLTVIGTLSICAAEAAIGKNASGAFYLMPYRIGEFSMGAICAWLPAHSAIRGWIRNALVLLGFGLIFYAVFGYTETTRFPGLTVLVPCFGAVLLIRFGENSIAMSLLANRTAVGIGSISYSLYLIHWPLYVFFRQWHGSDPGLGKTLAVSAISFIIAVAMHRYIEQPLRIRNQSAQAPLISTHSFVKLFAGVTICLIVISVMIWFGNGWPWRFKSDLARFAKEAEAEKTARFALFQEPCRIKDCISYYEPVVKGINVFILGDSHAPDAFNALVTQYPQFHYVLSGGMGGCPPLVREDYDLLGVKHPDRDGCVAKNEKLFHGNQLSKADLVVINTVFSWYKPEHLERSIIQIRNRTKAPIIVLGNYMFFDEDVPEMVIRYGSKEMNAHYENILTWNSFAFDDELKSLSGKLNFTYISKRELFCKGGSINDCPLMFEDKLFTYDRHHFSMAASRRMGVEIKNQYNEIFIGIQK